MSASELDPVLATLLVALDQFGLGVHGYQIRDGGLHRLFVTTTGATRLGYSVEELLALPTDGAIAPHDRARVNELLRRVYAGEAPISTVEVDMLHKDGGAVPTEVVTVYRDDPGGRILISLMRDIGVQASRSMLETDRLAVVGALAAGIAHEINNPLTYILLHLRSLRRSVDEWAQGHVTEAARRTDEAYAGAERIRAIVRAVMTFAASPGAQVDVDLGAVVQSALRLARPELESRARVVCQMYPVQVVRADEPRLGQAVLSMLLFASAGFRGDDPTLNRILIAVEMRAGNVVLEVADNGRGLTPTETARVFEPTFVRTSVEGPSYGLGVARAIAIGAGGQLAVGGRPGGGVVITLTLPAVEAPEVGSPIASEPRQG
jgi:PAS domain S-box-containing protein